MSKCFGPSIALPRNVLPSAQTNFPFSLIDQPLSVKQSKSRGCIECHNGIEDMHTSPNVVLGCTDCHGGNPTPGLTQSKAHVAAAQPIFWETSANPERLQCAAQSRIGRVHSLHESRRSARGATSLRHCATSEIIDTSSTA